MYSMKAIEVKDLIQIYNTNRDLPDYVFTDDLKIWWPG